MEDQNLTIEIIETIDSLMVEITSSAVTVLSKYAMAKCLTGDFNVFLPEYLAYGDGSGEKTESSSLSHEKSVERCGLFSTDITEYTYTETAGQLDVTKTGYYVSFIFVDSRNIKIEGITELGMFSSVSGGQCMAAARLSETVTKEASSTLMILWRIKVQ